MGELKMGKMKELSMLIKDFLEEKVDDREELDVELAVMAFIDEYPEYTEFNKQCDDIKNAFTNNFNDLKNDDDRCDVCGVMISHENWDTIQEDRGEFWGAPCSEIITTGYKCSVCGHKENF